ncbi:hypothetical protein OH76DRAFT_1529665 [Lentinus brumalis]|uniref:Uncharacterized protein n=1 Tax=Lentinus brumalis TaxID=2498619 RepID=A0A371DR46_9APHY|nr:hypothetical protein OH76DRAFT_1529665 [Polyporus brumalis]
MPRKRIPSHENNPQNHTASTALKFCVGGGGGDSAVPYGVVQGKMRRRSEEERRGEMERKRGRMSQDGDAETIVCAWWTGMGAPHERPDGQKILSHMYETSLEPTRPLEEGRTVRLLALPKCTIPLPVASIDWYSPYEPHVYGEVIRIVDLGEGWARATMLNECKGNAVGVVDLDIPNVPGVTINTERTSPKGGAAGWTGGVPMGCREWTEEGGVGCCRGARCSLQQDAQCGEHSFRVIPKKTRWMKESGKMEMVKAEGVAAIHLWLKYEGYI